MREGRGIPITGGGINTEGEGSAGKGGVCTVDKTVLQRFAVWAYKELSYKAVKSAGELGIYPGNPGDALHANRAGEMQLIKYFRENGFEKAIEDAVCLTFIRLICISYVEANGYVDSASDILDSVLPSFSEAEENLQVLLNLKNTEVSKRIKTDIPESAWLEGVQIVGWLYQYFISERHESLVDAVGKSPISKDDIPIATQIFTPEWIVRYMVDNSLGRYWIERNPESRLRSTLQFLVTTEDGKLKYVDDPVRPQDISFIDPCMGSAHILVYAFEVFMEIYGESGYTDSEAARMIVSRNLYGLDVDDRCTRLAYFSVIMKAISFDPDFLKHGVKPHLLSIQESDDVPHMQFDNENVNESVRRLIKIFDGAKEKGSLIEPESVNYDELLIYIDEYGADENTTFMLKRLLEQAKLLSKKYEIVCTNPPYMNKLGPKLKKFVSKKFRPYSGDLFSVFIYRCLQLCAPEGYCAYMTPFVWMFIKTYEKLREYIISEHFIVTLIQMEYSAFEEAVVPLCAFVLKNGKEDSKGCYIRLSEFKGGMDVQRAKVLESLKHKSCGWFFEAEQENFMRYPGSPIAYWANGRFADAFENSVNLNELSDYTGSQNKTADNRRFLRFFWEVENDQIGPGKRWIFYSKGGEYRKHYGNLLMVADWSNEAREYYRKNPNSNLLDKSYWYREGIAYTMLTSKGPSFRYMPAVGTFDMGGPEICGLGKELYYVLGFLGSRVAEACLGILNPTMNLQAKDVKALPVIISGEFHDEAEKAERECVRLSKDDWDSFETSYNFKRNPLIRGKALISEAFGEWRIESETRFKKLKITEEKINRFFIRIYGLENELSPDVSETDVTVRKADASRDIRTLISYAVGCIFGRYSLDSDGIIYAGGAFDKKKYYTFQPVPNNTVLLSGSSADNDIMRLFELWLEAAFGKESIEENLNFIACALGGTGDSRETIHRYFLRGFYSDHCKIYRKRPVYWLFDSGPGNGFKALSYMHRFEGGPPLRIISRHAEQIKAQYQEKLATIDKASKCFRKLQKQEIEISEFLQKLSCLMEKNIKLNFNNGVEYNYALFNKVLAKIK